MTFRSRRLEELLGGTLDAVTYADIAALAGNPDAAEAEDLDYKQAHCTSEAKSREELAKDVRVRQPRGRCDHHRHGRAPWRPLEGLRRRPRRRPSARAPAAVRWHHVLKENSPAPGPGSCLSVPRSPQAPHAVTSPPVKATTAALRYPRRGGSTTKSETDRNVPHLLVTLVPDVPGDMRIGQASSARYEPGLRQAQPRLGQDVRPFKAVSVLSGRLMLHDPRVRQRSDLAYLCTDGSGI
ncbi:hypothetical protein [Streptomyces sp. NBC_00467]|uniref:hypothetical protein n=1 Tax=Streptomyces sp. NBC_00467 TaxID=2975752 RepID=UPI002E18CE1B